MNSFFQSLARLTGLKAHQPRAQSDEEQATIVSTLAPSHIPTTGNRVASDDALTLFRLMLGITIAPHLGFDGSPVRPADNIGLYARVVHAEQTAKDSYKVFSAIINVCYFSQIIVAAALTALGAANADSRAVTAFGAINTIIAGFLTYLKGSGYPARLKYYASEWKKVREFIEHRERDFSLEGCTLDVYEVVDAIREMYNNTKREIEMNTPDGYNSKFPAQFDGVDTAKAEAIANKLRSLDDTARKLRSHIGSVSGGIGSKSDEVAARLRGLDDSVRKLRTDVSEGVEEKSVDVAAKLRSVEDTLDKEKAHAQQTVLDSHDTAHKAAQDTARSAADAARDEKKRLTGELWSLGNTVARGVEEHKPRTPHEVSVTLSHSHRDGNDQTDESEAGPRK